MSDTPFTRRQAFSSLATLLLPSIESPPRLAPLDELVLVEEFQDNAKLVLPAAVFSDVAGGDRRAFDRITFRPRVMHPTLDMNLGVELFGGKHFTPLLLGPFPDQGRLWADGEVAAARGAAAAQTGMIVSNRASEPLERIAAATSAPLWFEAAAGPGASAAIRRAVAAGCKVVCLPLGSDPRPAHQAGAAVVMRGVANPAEARQALAAGADGVMVESRAGAEAGILALPAIVDAVAGRAPVLLDSHFELGVDILKALAYGAAAVTVSRPAMWGLAAHGSDGVRVVFEMLQGELARGMGMCGAVTPRVLSRELLRLHA